MKAHNSRKLPKEHRLFLKKGHRLELTSINGDHVSFKMLNYDINRREESEFQITSGMFSYGSCYKQLSKIVPLYTITTKVRDFERKNNVKITDLGLTRKDFSKDMNFEKIGKALHKIK